MSQATMELDDILARRGKAVSLEDYRELSECIPGLVEIVNQYVYLPIRHGVEHEIRLLIKANLERT